MSSDTLTAILTAYRKPLILAMLVMVAETAATLLVPWLGGRLTDSLLNAPAAQLGTLPILLIAVLALQAVLRMTGNYLTALNAENIRLDLRTVLFDHAVALPLSYHQERRLGHTLALFNTEVGQIANFTAGTIVRAVPLVLVLAGAMIQMALIDWRLAAITLVVVPPFLVMMKIAGRRLRHLAHELRHEEAAATALEEEALSLLPLIKEFTREDLENTRYRVQATRSAILGQRVQTIVGTLEPGVRFGASLAVVLFMWLASFFLSDGSLTPGALVAFLLYAFLLANPISALASLYGQSQLFRAALERIRTTFDQPRETEADAALPSPALSGAISFRGVSFAYPHRPALLTNFDLDIAAGEIVALTGANGAGKSTIVHLLLRLYVPLSGTISIDGHDIATLDLECLRGQIGIVPQNVLLMNATVRDNIAFGRPAAARDDIIAAAHTAQAHNFIEALPNGYDTLIGDNGIRLSGGQRQRLALARALLKDPPIIVLDEATAMFDPAAEASFVAGAAKALSGRTVILITHRPASLALASRVIELAEGSVVKIVTSRQREAARS